MPSPAMYPEEQLKLQHRLFDPQTTFATKFQYDHSEEIKAGRTLYHGTRLSRFYPGSDLNKHTGKHEYFSGMLHDHGIVAFNELGMDRQTVFSSIFGTHMPYCAAWHTFERGPRDTVVDRNWAASYEAVLGRESDYGRNTYKIFENRKANLRRQLIGFDPILILRCDVDALQHFYHTLAHAPFLLPEAERNTALMALLGTMDAPPSDIASGAQDALHKISRFARTLQIHASRFDDPFDLSMQTTGIDTELRYIPASALTVIVPEYIFTIRAPIAVDDKLPEDADQAFYSVESSIMTLSELQHAVAGSHLRFWRERLYNHATAAER